MASSLLLSPNSSAALAACGLVNFIWPSKAPVISIGDMPPISPQIYFQLQPFSRLMSRTFSVNSARLILSSCSAFHGYGFRQPDGRAQTRLVDDRDSAYISYSTRTV